MSMKPITPITLKLVDASIHEQYVLHKTKQITRMSIFQTIISLGFCGWGFYYMDTNKDEYSTKLRMNSYITSAVQTVVQILLIIIQT